MSRSVPRVHPRPSQQGPELLQQVAATGMPVTSWRSWPLPVAAQRMVVVPRLQRMVVGQGFQDGCQVGVESRPGAAPWASRL